MKAALFVFTVTLFMSPGILFSETPQMQNSDTAELESRVLLAHSTHDYPVTPGDVYLLSWVTMTGAQSIEIVIRGDYQAHLGIFGVLQAHGMTYLQFAAAVEQKVTAVYPQGRPQCIVRSTGIFLVRVQGEVKLERTVECWGLTRLSAIVGDNATNNSSYRNVEVKSQSNSTQRYDLFAARRMGIREQDPYIRPGDVITVKRTQTRVVISGEVNKPGVYELAEGEGLADLIEKYAEGFSVLGDTARIRIVRTLSAEKNGESFLLDSSTSEYKSFKLRYLDEVTVGSRVDSFPVVHFEGAVVTGKPGTASELEPAPGKYTSRITGGERLGSIVRGMREVFSPFASLSEAYIIRRDRDLPIPANLEKLIFDYSAADDVVLEAQDRIIVPFKKYYVTVSGAVLKPGRYQYAPGKRFSYYLDVAGGTDPQKNSGNSVIISDSNENRLALDRVIQPDDRIYAEYNNGLYHFQQWGVVLGTTVSVAALVVGIIQLTR